MKAIPFTLIVAVATLAACSDHLTSDADRTTSIPAGADRSLIIFHEPRGFSAPPAQPDYSAPPADANHAAPGTDPAVAFANKAASTPEILPKNDAHLAVQAETAAVRAPDTASADAAKKAVLADGDTGTRVPGTARDTAANSPRHGNLTPAEESTQMPKAGQVNNHSSPALEKDSSR